MSLHGIEIVALNVSYASIS